MLEDADLKRLLAGLDGSPSARWETFVAALELGPPTRRDGLAVDVQLDIAHFTEHLRRAILGFGAPVGAVYVGLDTQNGVRDAPYNVELGLWEVDGTAGDVEDWLYGPRYSAPNHLIVGIQRLGSAFEGSDSCARADYALPLSYLGLVVTVAAARSNLPVGCVLVWGWHDGDMCSLVLEPADGAETMLTWV